MGPKSVSALTVWLFGSRGNEHLTPNLKPPRRSDISHNQDRSLRYGYLKGDIEESSPVRSTHRYHHSFPLSHRPPVTVPLSKIITANPIPVMPWKSTL